MSEPIDITNLEFYREPTVKKHMVTIQGIEIEVGLARKLEILRAGEDKYMLENNAVVLKPKPKTNRRFLELHTDENGYNFYDNYQVIKKY